MKGQQNRITASHQACQQHVLSDDYLFDYACHRPEANLWFTSTSGKRVTLYMEKREFCDLGSCTEPVEGVVVLDADQLQPNERLLVALVGRFRYGREEDEILGMTLCREVYLGHTQLCHEQPSSPRTPQAATGSSTAEPPKSPGRALYAMQLGPVHRRLMDALGEAAVPFRFEFPRDAPVSTVMQRLTPESGDTCGVRYLVRCYTLLDEEETPAQSNECVTHVIDEPFFSFYSADVLKVEVSLDYKRCASALLAAISQRLL
ncbi:hypothetical protein HPB51_008323 [Rhipicephalus microplus]|uniref:Arrestin-like N-terminal domain-containing protein n=1 Tax=Rhipicephalus microplus TaxID=6941 RepID=A0A9J6EZ48_RHIMP|nr:hypothetical protein HPB51_008323 [Rhipicephalus microplus]